MQKSTLPPTREHELIGIIGKITGSKYLGDDCALLADKTLVSTDCLVENIHFRLATTSFFDLGYKAVAVNLSDIAAMGGYANYLLSTISMPDSISTEQFQELIQGMQSCIGRYQGQIVGGDLTGGTYLSISLTVIGSAHENGVLTRNGGKAGDIIIVTGDFGASRMGLKCLSENTAGYSYLKKRHLKPEPRLAQACFLNKVCQGQGALMDASDGLADAVVQIARASQLGAVINESKIPIHKETISACAYFQEDQLQTALYGGEDYELVGAVSPAVWEILCIHPDNPFVAVGHLSADRQIYVNRNNGHKTPVDLKHTYQHFSP